MLISNHLTRAVLSTHPTIDHNENMLKLRLLISRFGVRFPGVSPVNSRVCRDASSFLCSLSLFCFSAFELLLQVQKHNLI